MKQGVGQVVRERMTNTISRQKGIGWTTQTGKVKLGGARKRAALQGVEEQLGR